MLISAVIPTYNEAESLRQLHAELSATAEEHGYDLDIVFIDDGSTDSSWKTIQALAADDSRVRGIRFRRNFGKAAALTAGFAAARGQVVVTLDADLQDDPREIANLLDVMQGQEVDVVSGWKQVRHDPWHKVYPSKVFNGMVSWMTGVKLHDHNCGLKLYRRLVVKEVRLYGELHRFVPVLAHARGFRVGECVVKHRPRQHGSSKYGFRRFFKGFLDLLTVSFITGFGHRPQHLLGTIGLLSFFIGLAGMAYCALYWVVVSLSGYDPMLHARPVLYYSLGALIIGGQFLSVGFLAELLTAYLGHEMESYSVAETTDADQRLAAADANRGADDEPRGD